MRLCSLWSGGPLGYLEKLSLASAVSVGHAVTLFSYNPTSLIDLPAGVNVDDANNVMSDPRRTRLLKEGHFALASDFFRYEILAKRLGCWIDLDLIFLRQLPPCEYLFGWESEYSINGAVLALPNGALLDTLRKIPEKNWLPPYFGPRRTFQYLLNRAFGPVYLEDLPWGAVGPELITYLVKAHGIEHLAQPREAFYPVRYQDAKKLYDQSDAVDQLIADSTITVHMWNSKLRELAKRPPPPNSFVGRMCSRYSVDICTASA